MLISRISSGLASDKRVKLLGHSSAESYRLTTNLAKHRPTVLLVDWREQTPDDIANATKFHAALAPTCCCWSRTPTPALVEAILRHGLHAYLCAESAPDECSRAIYCLAQGDIWMPRATLAAAVADLLPSGNAFEISGHKISRTGPCVVASSQITSGEQQIIMLVMQGLTNKQIARNLDIADVTVKKHL